jgi:hypothetical protein
MMRDSMQGLGFGWKGLGFVWKFKILAEFLLLGRGQRSQWRL